MEKIVDVVKDLHRIRKLPQFLFVGGIHPQSMLEVRERILEYKNINPESDEIDFIINSPGGSPSDAYRIIRTLRNNFTTVNIIVPFWAKSAATLLSLGGSKIIMDEFGEFGPLDLQIAKERDDRPDIESESALNDEYSLQRLETRSQELFKKMFINLYEDQNIPINKNELSKQLLEYISCFYKPLLKQINPYKIGEKKRKLEIGEKYAQRILTLYQPMTDKNKRFLIDYLVNGCPDHSYIIDFSLITVFLNNVIKSSDISAEYQNTLSKLSSLFIAGEDSGIEFVEIIEGSEPTEKDALNSVQDTEKDLVDTETQQN